MDLTVLEEDVAVLDLVLRDIAHRPERGIDIEPIVREVAAISNDVDHYGMGSTRFLLTRGLESH